MMTNQEKEEEQELPQKTRIKSQAYSVLVSLLLLPILFQQYILHAPTSQFAGELISLLAILIYVGIKKNSFEILRR